MAEDFQRSFWEVLSESECITGQVLRGKAGRGPLATLASPSGNPIEPLARMHYRPEGGRSAGEVGD